MSAVAEPAARAAAPSAPSGEWRPSHNPWAVAIIATLAPFMEVLDTSIANVALPHIAGNLGATVDDSTWVLTSYLVSNAIVLPISAWCSSLMGRRNFYLVCVALFTASSLLCGLAPSLGMLVVFRLLQGLGGGGLQPSTQAILVDTFPPAKRGMGMAVYGMTVVVAPVIGPTLGGWITDNASWRWLFFLNVPVGLASLALASRFIEDPPYLRRRIGAERWRVDWVGLGLLAIGLGGLQLTLDLGERHDWFASGWISGLAIVSGTAIALCAVWEWHHRDPIVDLRLLRERNTALANAVMLVFGFTLFGSTVMLPLLMQTLLGYTATQSGMVLSPGGIVILVMMPIIGQLVSRVDVRWLVLFGTAVVAASLWLMGGLSLDVDQGRLIWLRMIQGFGLAFMFVPVNTAAYAYVPRHLRNAASSLISLSRNIGASVGIALIATLLARQAQHERAMLVGHVSPTSLAWVEQRRELASRIGDQGAIVVADRRVQAQAQMIAYDWMFMELAVGFLVLVPLVLAMRSAKSGNADVAAH